MARGAEQVDPTPSGRSLGYLWDRIAAAREAAVELENSLDSNESVLTLANAASALEDRFADLRMKLYQIAETIDS